MFILDQEILTYTVLGLAFLVVILLLWLIVLQMRLSKMQKFQKAVLQSGAGASLEEMLMQHISELRYNKEKIEIIQSRQDDILDTLKGVLQKVGIVRFNAFDDMGGDQSFALAILDAEKNGFVLSGLFGRSDMRVYAKPIIDNKSSYLLSEEEQKAIEKANRKVV